MTGTPTKFYCHDCHRQTMHDVTGSLATCTVCGAQQTVGSYKAGEE